MDTKKLLIKHGLSYHEKAAFVFEERPISFLELRDNSFRLANYLLKKGIGSADKVALFLPNIPEAVFSFLGIFSLGAKLVPLDFMLTEEEVINFITHSEAKVLITQPKKEVNLANIKNSCLNLKEIIVCNEKIEGFSFWEEALKKSELGEPQTKFNEDELSSIFYTSGSTGHPKGVMLNYRHLDNPPETINHFLGVSHKDIFLTGGIPFSHIGGLDYILLMLRFTSTLILMERFHPLEFLKKLEKHKITIFCIVPSMYVAILSLKEYDKFDLSSLRYAAVFGAPSSPVLLEKFHRVCPKAIVVNGWGMTETSAPNTYSPLDETKLNSIGNFGFRMKARIVDDSGRDLKSEARGELWVKGDGIMAGYYKEPNLTKEVLTEDGWLKTGDIAYFDGEGLIYLAGRKKDMIKVAGEIVFSSEVEEKMQRYSKIKEVAVIGVLDKLRGEVPKAFIVPKENENINLQELKDFLRGHLAHFKIPHYFEFIKELPKNRVGKIDKVKLEAETRGTIRG